MEFILHFMYVVAIKDTQTWQGASPMELSMIGFWNLIVWLKVFVALWHDLTFRSPTCGLFISLFVLPEMLITCRIIIRAEQVRLY